ncbi:kinase-like protein [Hyaloscypha variabilis F]|uniref:Kinase-like protein n=1 Tax=Hyaloscypha variabilis (strain UAMH 11265 / GT02V1 / F) TaxID=1149755 RepID=A0A2J6RY03_HYAVF|nr:kinase-like protein [Hyaloscypha variabilis F]
MAGKRLLDVAALFNASRGVVQKHVALRARQVDVYNRTSTIAKALKNQTDRVTETAKAASFLASRLNESGPAWTSEAAETPAESQSRQDGPIPSKESTEGGQASKSKNGLEQDHFYERSTGNSTADPVPEEELEVQQERADSYPLPDGTIPPAKSGLNVNPVDHEAFSTRPQDEAVKRPLEIEGLQPTLSNASTIISPPRKPLSPESARKLQRQSELQIPSKSADALDDTVPGPLEMGHDKDSFYRKSRHTSPVLSSLPRVKTPKHTSSTQGVDSHLPEGQINSDSFYTAGSSESITAVAAVPEQDEVPEGVDTALFYSPRVARLLGGRTQGFNQNALKLKGVKDTPIDHTGLAANKDQDIFNVRASEVDNSMVPEVGSGMKMEATKTSSNFGEGVEDLAHDISKDIDASQVQVGTTSAPVPHAYELRESKVPSSRLGRLWNYSGLAAGLVGGAVSESFRRLGGSGGDGSYLLSAGNMDRLVTKLSKMRGAALKLGQMISFQDSKMLPGPIQEVLQRVQDRADYMPPSQRNKVLSANLGPEWRNLFSSFEEKPLAAASIGQVHSAVLKSTGAKVAVKVQYPGVADSIDSDLNNLAVLLTASRLLPKGLFLDKTIANARTELAWECDYIREAECGHRFEQLLADETDVFLVPKVYPEASGRQVLTMEFMEGIGVTRVKSFSQEQRDWIGTQILRLCLREITEFKFMQTDPNWTNFLYNAQTNKLELLDFGASREYPEEFIKKYTQLLAAASRSDRETVRDMSIDLGYLTGHESKTMLDAHIASVLTLAEPFLDSSPGVYDFEDQTITDRVKELIPVMIRERLAPPPEETYSLHRKLSGAFLLCARLGSRVRCRELFENSMNRAGIL